MQNLVEYAPATLIVVAAGIAAGGIIALFRTFGPRIKTRDLIAGREDPTRWVWRDGKKIPPIAPSQLVVYTGSAGLPQVDDKTVEAEIVDSDERTRKLVRR